MAAWGQPATEAAEQEHPTEQGQARGSPQGSSQAGKEQQPAALDVAPGPQGHQHSTARALHAGQDTMGAAAAFANAAVPPAGAGWQWKGLLTPRSCPASELAAEAAAAAAAGGGPVQQQSPGAGSAKKRRQPQAASSRAAPTRSAAARRLHGGSPPRLATPCPRGAFAATPGRAAAAAAVFAAAAAAPESPAMPTVVQPSPAQLSPESLRYRQSLAQAAPSVQQAAKIGATGQHSPDSQRFKQQAAQTSVAVSQLQLRRLMSEAHQGMPAAAAEAEEDLLEERLAGIEREAHLATPTSRYWPPQQEQQEQQAGAETPRGSVVGSAAAAGRPSSPDLKAQVKQQPLSPGIPAAVIGARLAQAEQVGRACRCLCVMTVSAAKRASGDNMCLTHSFCLHRVPHHPRLACRLCSAASSARAPSPVLPTATPPPAPHTTPRPSLQLTPISALRALRSSLALMAGAHDGAAGRGAGWAAQQHQMQGILERVEARFRCVQGGASRPGEELSPPPLQPGEELAQAEGWSTMGRRLKAPQPPDANELECRRRVSCVSVALGRPMPSNPAVHERCLVGCKAGGPFLSVPCREAREQAQQEAELRHDLEQQVGQGLQLCGNKCAPAVGAMYRAPNTSLSTQHQSRPEAPLPPCPAHHGPR